MNSPDLNPIENLWWNFLKIFYNKGPSTKDDISTTIWESLNHFE